MNRGGPTGGGGGLSGGEGLARGGAFSAVAVTATAAATTASALDEAVCAQRNKGERGCVGGRGGRRGGHAYASGGQDF